MQNRVTFTIFGGLIILCLGFIFWFGIRPRAISLIDLSFSTNIKTIARDILLRLPQEEFSHNKIFCLGVQPERPEQMELAEQLIDQLGSRANFRSIVVEKFLAQSFSKSNAPMQTIDIQNEFSALTKSALELYSAEAKLLLILPTQYCSHMLKANPVRSLESELEKMASRPLEVVSFNIAELLRSREEETKALFPCRPSESTQGQVDILGCSILQTGRFLYKKTSPPATWPFLMELRAKNDYLILLGHGAY